MGRDQSGWIWHMGAGLIILVLLGLHMAVMHLDGLLGWFNPAGGHPIDWANVVARARSAFFMMTYVLLLGAALFHGLYGLRGILFELSPATSVQKAMDWALVVGGLLLLVLGSWAAWANFAAAQAL